MSVIVNRQQFRSAERKDGRLKMLTLLFFLLGFIIILRLFTLQVIRHGFYADLSARRNDISRELLPTRGSIFVREAGKLYPVVTNKDYYFVWADPRKVTDKKRVVDSLTPILEFEEEEWKALLEKLGKTDDPYEPIKNKVPKETVERIDALALDGIYSNPETFRFYPEKEIGGHIFGFLGYDTNKLVGRYGIEGYFQDQLSGVTGQLDSLKDAQGLPVTVGDRSYIEAIDGSNIVLTIDRNIQTKACEVIKSSAEAFGAEGGTILVMNPQTGAVIAMCSVPDFDPENYNEVENIDYFNNPAIYGAYEPGSVFKAFTMAAALDLKLVEPETTYEDTGEVKLIGQKPIRNSDLQAYGTQTMIQVLEKSLNTGAVFVVDKIGKKDFRTYVENFGFGNTTGIQLDYEAEGNISSLDKRGEIYTITASFGQGITATPIQLLTAFSAIANGGKLMKPYIVDEIRIGDTTVEKTEPQKVRQAIGTRAATLLHGMLVSVVENGFGSKASVPGYYIAGKTGTAQVADKSGKYGNQTIHTFIGYGPATNPKFSMLVKLDKPTAVNFSSDSATPIFGQMAEYILNYYQVPHER